MWFSLHDFKQMSIWFMVRSDFSNLRSRRNIINLLFSNIKLLFFKKKSPMLKTIYIFFPFLLISEKWASPEEMWPVVHDRLVVVIEGISRVDFILFGKVVNVFWKKKVIMRLKKNGYDAKMTKHKWLSEGRLEHIDIVVSEDVSRKAQVLPEARLFPWCVLGKNPGSCLPYSRNQDHWKSCGTGGT